MVGRLIRWLVTMLFIVVTGTLIGWTIRIIVEEVPLWVLVVVLMVIALALFKFAVWAIGQSDYV